MNEFDLIARFVSCFDVAPTPRGPGDDCAVLPAQPASCVTTDAVVEGVHFTRPAFSLEDVGHKALAVNLSDLAAMGAEPAWFTVALGVPADVAERDVVALGRGMSALAKLHRIELLGGNVTAARQLSVTITASGKLDARPLLRSGARAGDLLFVSGPLGDAAGGLLAMRRNKRAPEVRAAQKRPTPHVAFGRAIRHLASACIDVSDGLLQDLSHLCAASNVGAELQREQVPVSEALQAFAGDEALELALRGGEDYVLLFAAPPRHREAVLALGGLEIGALTAAPGLRVDGTAVTGRLGHQHLG